MIANIEVLGFTIKIEDLEGKITVTAEKDGEVMEEFVLTQDEEGTEAAEEPIDGEEAIDGEEESELKSFDQFEKEEDEKEEGDEEQELPESDETEEPLKENLLTFDKFLNKKK